MEAKLNLLFRTLTLAAAAALLWPASWLIHLAGLAALVVIFIVNRRHDLPVEAVGHPG